MNLVEPRVELIAETAMDNEAVYRYLEDIGAEEYELHHDTTDAEELIMLAGKACYKSFIPKLNPNVSKVRDKPSEYLANINATGHGSVTEHASFTFMFWNVSRVFTHELVRHRVGTAMSQESLRFVRLTDLNMWLPSCIRDNPTAMAIFKNTVVYLEQVQKDLARLYNIEGMKNFSKKKVLTSAFRRIAPIGLATAIMFTTNVRTARHLIQMRTSRHAEEEIRLVFDQVAKLLVNKHKQMFADFKCEEYEGIGEWTCENAATPYDIEKIKKLRTQLMSGMQPHIDA